MQTVNELRVSVKVRNNRLLQAIEAAGHTPGVIFAKQVGITYQSLNDLINFKTSPFDRDGNYKDKVYKLSVALNKMASELFPEHVLVLEKNVSHAELSVDALPELMSTRLAIEDKEGQAILDTAIQSLLPNEQFVLKHRYGLEGEEHTLDIMAENLGITRERVRQIEAKALRKLRHPKRYKDLREQFDIPVEDLSKLTPEEEERQRLWVEDCRAKAKEAHETFWRRYDADAK